MLLLATMCSICAEFELEMATRIWLRLTVALDQFPYCSLRSKNTAEDRLLPATL